MYKILKYFEKGQPHACDYRMHEAARIYPERPDFFKKKTVFYFLFHVCFQLFHKVG